MTDTKALEAAIVAAGVMKKHICSQLGLTFQGLSDKVNGRTEFKASEIRIMQDVLRLTNEERDRIFFAPSCD